MNKLFSQHDRPSVLLRDRPERSAMTTTTVYEPGAVVPTSGLYGVVDRSGRYLGVEITCVAGHRFPPTRVPGGHGYVLRDRTIHRSN